MIKQDLSALLKKVITIHLTKKIYFVIDNELFKVLPHKAI